MSMQSLKKKFCVTGYKNELTQNLEEDLVESEEDTLGKSSNRSPRDFNILTRLGHIQKLSLFQGSVFYICGV